MEQIIKSNLLFKATANLTKRGVVFNGHIYENDQIMKEIWVQQFIARGQRSVQIYYDIFNFDYIIIAAIEGELLILKRSREQTVILKNVIHLSNASKITKAI
jgi:hypothetical protein